MKKLFKLIHTIAYFVEKFDKAPQQVTVGGYQ